jgi:hypothetical protein
VCAASRPWTRTTFVPASRSTVRLADGATSCVDPDPLTETTPAESPAMSIAIESVTAVTVTGGASPLAVLAVGSGVVPAVPVPGVVAAVESHGVDELELVVDVVEPDPAPDPPAGVHGVAVTEPPDPDAADVVPASLPLVPAAVIVAGVVTIGAVTLVSDVPVVVTVVVVVVVGAATVAESVVPMVAVVVGGALLDAVSVVAGAVVVVSLGPLTVVVDDVAGVVDGSSDAEKKCSPPSLGGETSLVAVEVSVAGGGCVDGAGADGAAAAGADGSVIGVPTWSLTTGAAANGSASALLFDELSGTCACRSLTTGTRWRTVFVPAVGVAAAPAPCLACLSGGSGAIA